MEAVSAKTPKTGGYGGLLRMAKDPDVQDAIYTLAIMKEAGITPVIRAQDAALAPNECNFQGH